MGIQFYLGVIYFNNHICMLLKFVSGCVIYNVLGL